MEKKNSPVFSDQAVFSPDHPATSPVINPEDYEPNTGVWGGLCAVCGGKWVQYTEKFSPKMKAEDRFSYKICQKCYDWAVARKSESFIALSSLLHTAHMVRGNTVAGVRCVLQVLRSGLIRIQNRRSARSVMPVSRRRQRDYHDSLDISMVNKRCV